MKWNTAMKCCHAAFMDSGVGGGGLMWADLFWQLGICNWKSGGIIVLIMQGRGKIGKHNMDIHFCQHIYLRRLVSLPLTLAVDVHAGGGWAQTPARSLLLWVQLVKHVIVHDPNRWTECAHHVESYCVIRISDTALPTAHYQWLQTSG